MKWILVFFIATVPETDSVDLYAFPELPFDSERNCRELVQNFYWEFQDKVNKGQGTKDMQYPPLCIKESDFYKLIGNPT